MKHKIHGDVMQTVTFELKENESIYSQRGAMCFMSSNITMSTNFKGGLFRSIKRRFSGESLFLNTFRSSAGDGLISFSTDSVGKIMCLELDGSKNFICQKDAFLCAQDSVSLDIEFQKKLGRGFFGGEGFVLQKLHGSGLAFVSIDGELLEVTLKDGQQIRVDTGHVAVYDSSVNYDIARMKGIGNMFLGGEGLFVATLTGPGKVYLQTLPRSKLAQSLSGFGARSSGGILSLFY